MFVPGHQDCQPELQFRMVQVCAPSWRKAELTMVSAMVANTGLIHSQMLQTQKLQTIFMQSTHVTSVKHLGLKHLKTTDFFKGTCIKGKTTYAISRLKLHHASLNTKWVSCSAPRVALGQVCSRLNDNPQCMEMGKSLGGIKVHQKWVNHKPGGLKLYTCMKKVNHEPGGLKFDTCIK